MPPPDCPHCGVCVDATLQAAEAAEWQEASEATRVELGRAHIKRHAGGLRGKQPAFMMDHRTRARSALHRRMNACGNNLAATFLKVPFKLKTRQDANALLND